MTHAPRVTQEAESHAGGRGPFTAQDGLDLGRAARRGPGFPVAVAAESHSLLIWVVVSKSNTHTLVP